MAGAAALGRRCAKQCLFGRWVHDLVGAGVGDGVGAVVVGILVGLLVGLHVSPACFGARVVAGRHTHMRVTFACGTGKHGNSYYLFRHSWLYLACHGTPRRHANTKPTGASSLLAPVGTSRHANTKPTGTSRLSVGVAAWRAVRRCVRRCVRACVRACYRACVLAEDIMSEHSLATATVPHVPHVFLQKWAGADPGRWHADRCCAVVFVLNFAQEPVP